jgi:hypothetical protein
MVRIVDLKALLPQLMTEYTELNDVMTVETTELNRIETEHEIVVDNRYIPTCNEDGIVRFERIMSIVPNSNDTLEDRKFRCISKWSQSIPYNYKVLDEKLAMLCGEGMYDLSIDFDNYIVYIKLGVASKNQFKSVVELFDAIVPCNMEINASIKYNTHGLLSELTHEQLSAFTHDQLRNEVIN